MTLLSGPEIEIIFTIPISEVFVEMRNYTQSRTTLQMRRGI
jgi:hypothetical protein